MCHFDRRVKSYISACYIGNISRFARNYMLFGLFTSPSTLNREPLNFEPE